MRPEDFDFPHEEEFAFSPESDERLFNDVGLGHSVQTFIRSDPVGKYLWARCRQERVEAIQKMEDIALDDPKFKDKMTIYRTRSAFPRALLTYLEDAYLAGANAERELTDRDNREPQ